MKHDIIYVPRNASGRNKEEETAAEMRLEKVANSHFHKHGGVGVGFFRPRDPASGRRESILTMFVNHPQDVERGAFFAKRFAISSGLMQEWGNSSKSA